MPEYIFAAMIFFFCQIKAVEVALRSLSPSVANAGVQLNKLATRGRRGVVVADAGDAFQTAGRTPVWWKLRRRQVRTKRGTEEKKRTARLVTLFWLSFKTCAN